MINAIPLGSFIYGVLIGEFTEGTHRVVNPVIGIQNMNAQNPALISYAEDYDHNYIYSSDVYGNLSLNDWEPSENFNTVLVSALNARISGVAFTAGGGVILNDPPVVFSI